MKDVFHKGGFIRINLLCYLFSRSSVHSQQAVTAQRNSDLHKTGEICNAGFRYLSGKEVLSNHLLELPPMEQVLKDLLRLDGYVCTQIAFVPQHSIVFMVRILMYVSSCVFWRGGSLNGMQ